MCIDVYVYNYVYDDAYVYVCALVHVSFADYVYVSCLGFVCLCPRVYIFECL